MKEKRSMTFTSCSVGGYTGKNFTGIMCSRYNPRETHPHLVVGDHRNKFCSYLPPSLL